MVNKIYVELNKICNMIHQATYIGKISDILIQISYPVLDILYNV